MKKNNFLSLLILFSLVGFGYGKTKVYKEYKYLRNTATITKVAELEKRVTPFFESLLLRRSGIERNLWSNKDSLIIKENEIILAMKASNKFSSEFHKLYKKATELPDSLEFYISPSGHFEIYYKTKGLNGVDTTDHYQYDINNWRLKIDLPNGIPDYIDECAFALDSCWSMMIDRFGFPPPIPYKDEKYTSDLYKVLVEMQEESYYGFTYLFNPLPDSIGYRSLLSLRNNWSDPEWSELGYDKNPINGLRVTCAHEFFHAIQYSMSHQVTMDIFLDDFPLSWTEGTAVTMEELAFDSINDYHQYAKTYFNNPSISFLNSPISDIVYTNSILLIYITKHFPPDGRATFIRIMHENNYKERTGFHINLFNTCEKISKSWPDILHSFHCNSFFTGKFSDTVNFIPDASFFNMKTPINYPLQSQIKKRILSNSVVHIGITPSQNHSDTLKINLYIDTTRASNFLKCSIMQQKDENISFNTIILDNKGKGSYTIENWKEIQIASLVITNADPLHEREIYVEFDVDSITHNNSISKDIVFYPNPLSKKRDGGILYIRDSTLKDIYIYSMSGALRKKILAKYISFVDRKDFMLDCKELAPGSYMLIIGREAANSNSFNYFKHRLIIAP